MTERRAGPALHHSVFARLVAIMLVMAAILLGLVGGFFTVIVIPGIHASLESVEGPHARAIADTRPDFETAKRYAKTLNMGIRFEGPDGGWTTDDDMPTFDELGRRRSSWLSHVLIQNVVYYVAATPDGRYIFARRLGVHFGRAHTQMIAMLLVLMLCVFATAYLVMRRALRPLRLLGDGVARLGEGQLDVVVQKQSDDEFGVLTDAFNRMTRRVRDMVRARDQLLRDVSHELRSPLTRMRVALEMLPEGRERQVMRADVAEMETMVTALLERERVRDGHGLRNGRHDLVVLVREVVQRHAGRAPGVRIASTPPRLEVDLDPDGVGTVLRNLIENALKYALPDSRAVEVSVEHAGDLAVIRVTDDGPGIPAGETDRLFEPFHRPDASRSKKTGGYGLGLSICKRIMEAHGGTIRVETGTPRGAVFVLEFPAVGREA